MAKSKKKVGKGKKVKKLRVARRRMGETLQNIADVTELPRKQVKAVLEALADEVQTDLKDKKFGQFNFPFLGLKLRRIQRPAKPKRKGINPFTGKEQWFKAKPATTSVKATVMRKLKVVVA